MRWSRVWLLLGCLLVWGGGSAVSASVSDLASPARDRTAQGFIIDHLQVAATDEAESDENASLVERLRLQHDAHVAPLWQQVAGAPRDWRHERVALWVARRATAPPLVGVVELLI